MASELESLSLRRSFLGRFGAGVGVVGASLIASSVAQAAHRAWQPARHSQDDWLDKVPGVHRIVFDTTTPDEMRSALRYADNYYRANQAAYSLKDGDLAVVIIARHTSTPFGYNDAMWAKYGRQFSDLMRFTDPKTDAPPMVNVYTRAGDSSEEAGRMIDLAKRGAQFAVCATATRELSETIGKGAGVSPDSVAREISANLVGNARMVSAGIVTVDRAQERGYSLA